jgi:hypothetical protein
MLRNLKELQDYTLRAEDGQIGMVREFYFDDRQWTIRYLVADAGGWLTRRLVLIAPEALGTPQWDEHVLPVRLTRDQVRNSPDIDTAKPVSRQREAELRSYYGWPVYWETTAASLPTQTVVAPQQQMPAPTGDPHLRSTTEVAGARLEASDGEVGHVADILIEDETWAIRYLVIDTRNWWPGRKVVISPDWVTGINWAESKITVTMTRDVIKRSPPYDPLFSLDARYADQLRDYYAAIHST